MSCAAGTISYLQRDFMATNTEAAVVDPTRQLLRHTLATLAYRSGKALRSAPETFASFSTGGKVLGWPERLHSMAFASPPATTLPRCHGLGNESEVLYGPW